jgi:hypothetical protein
MPLVVPIQPGELTAKKRVGIRPLPFLPRQAVAGSIIGHPPTGGKSLNARGLRVPGASRARRLQET